MRKITLAIFLAVILPAATAGNFCYQLFWSQPEKNVTVTRLVVNDNASAANVIKDLKKKGLIKNAWLFKRYLISKKMDTQIKPGVWELQPGNNYRHLAQLITDGQFFSAEFTFLEGWNLRDYKNYLIGKKDYLHLENWVETGLPAIDYRQLKNEKQDWPKDFSSEFSFLQGKPGHVSLEGYLFPDTYRLRFQADGEEIIRQLLKNFDAKLTTELRLEISRQGKTIFQIVTMASLVEAEAQEDVDRRLVSDILWRRLSIGMPLQLDSTINYVLDTQKPAVTLKDREVDSPYNTYRYVGLPLGPINNPGLNAILAAIYSEKNDFWFFLTGTDGKMHYAKTLEEHNRNKNQYMK